jgi:hypothetical protein
MARTIRSRKSASRELSPRASTCYSTPRMLLGYRSALIKRSGSINPSGFLALSGFLAAFRVRIGSAPRLASASLV